MIDWAKEHSSVVCGCPFAPSISCTCVKAQSFPNLIALIITVTVHELFPFSFTFTHLLVFVFHGGWRGEEGVKRHSLKRTCWDTINFLIFCRPKETITGRRSKSPVICFNFFFFFYLTTCNFPELPGLFHTKPAQPLWIVSLGIRFLIGVYIT